MGLGRRKVDKEPQEQAKRAVDLKEDNTCGKWCQHSARRAAAREAAYAPLQAQPTAHHHPHWNSRFTVALAADASVEQDDWHHDQKAQEAIEVQQDKKTQQTRIEARQALHEAFVAGGNRCRMWQEGHVRWGSRGIGFAIGAAENEKRRKVMTNVCPTVRGLWTPLGYCRRAERLPHRHCHHHPREARWSHLLPPPRLAKCLSAASALMGRLKTKKSVSIIEEGPFRGSGRDVWLRNAVALCHWVHAFNVHKHTTSSCVSGWAAWLASRISPSAV